jgi:nicotinate-nucleotide pyrophosphorylase
MSFFASALFGLSWSLAFETCVNVDVLSFEEAILALDASQEVLQLTNAEAAFSMDVIAVLSADRVLSHSSGKMCDLKFAGVWI